MNAENRIAILMLLLATAASATVTLSSPADASWNNQTYSQIQFTYSYSDSGLGNITSCTLEIDGSANGQNATEGSITPSGEIAEGFRVWNVNCTNGTSYETAAASRTLLVDRTPPAISNLQANETNSLIDVSFSATDALSQVLSCSLYINGASSASQSNSSVQNSTQAIFGGINSSALPAGQNNFTVTCHDGNGTGNLNSASQTVQHTISGPPPAQQNATIAVALSSPQNNSWHNSLHANFSFTFVSNSTSPVSCSLFLNGSQNATNSSVQPNATTSFQNISLSWLPSETSLRWNVTCTEGSQGYSNSSILRIDRIAPSLTYTENSPTNRTYIWVNATANDSNLYQIRIWLYDEDGYEIDHETGSGPSRTFNFTGLAEGDYTLNISAYDSAGNSNSVSQSITIDITEGTTGPQTSSANTSRTVDVSAGGTQCSVLVRRVLSGSSTLSVVTTTLTNNGGVQCNLTNFIFTDTIPAAFGDAGSVSFEPSPTSRSGQQASFNLTSLLPGQAKQVAYSINSFVPASALSAFTTYTLQARLAIAQQPQQNQSSNQTQNQTANQTIEENQTLANESENGLVNGSLEILQVGEGNEFPSNESSSLLGSLPITPEVLVLGGASAVAGVLGLLLLIVAIYLFFRKKKSGGLGGV
jgi:hypothetical protein